MYTTEEIKKLISSNNVMVFSKSWCPFCKKVKDLFSGLSISYEALELDEIKDNGDVQGILYDITGQKTVPNIFIGGQHVGGCDKVTHLHSTGVLLDMVNGKLTEYDFDLVVVGGGSGGLAAAKEAGELGKKVLLCDFVVPTPFGTAWGLGGTCVNVGCIPKKLMHKASLIGEDLEDSVKFGWSFENIQHNWSLMVSEIQMYIKSLNFQYKRQLKGKNVSYKNAYVKFVDAHTVQLTDKNNTVEKVTAENFIIAVGTRPKYPIHCANACKLGITSDDLFSLTEAPGKTLLVGASYIALECAGFLNGLGIPCTVMVRSICLRGFDQQMAQIVTDSMKDKGVKFIEGCVLLNIKEAADGRKQVSWSCNNILSEDYFDTVIFAIGREARVSDMNLQGIGIQVHESGKILANEKEETSVKNIYAVGDIIYGKPELTPVAIQAGKLLVHRLYKSSAVLMDYRNVPTTVFTPLEYGCVGYSEEEAEEKFEKSNIEVYHANFNPLEFSLSKRAFNKPYVKLICLKPKDEQVIGLHIVGPNAGEIVQGFAIGVKLGAKKSDFDNLVGIHPTCAEVFTTLKTKKSSGESTESSGC